MSDSLHDAALKYLSGEPTATPQGTLRDRALSYLGEGLPQTDEEKRASRPYFRGMSGDVTPSTEDEGIVPFMRQAPQGQAAFQPRQDELPVTQRMEGYAPKVGVIPETGEGVYADAPGATVNEPSDQDMMFGPDAPVAANVAGSIGSRAANALFSPIVAAGAAGVEFALEPSLRKFDEAVASTLAAMVNVSAAPITVPAGVIGSAIADEESEGHKVPLAAKAANLPNIAFGYLNEYVGKPVEEATGSKTLGLGAELATGAVAFGGAKLAGRGVRAARGRLPSNVPGSTKPGAVRIRDAAPDAPVAEFAPNEVIRRPAPGSAPIEAPVRRVGLEARRLPTGETTAPIRRVPLAPRRLPGPEESIVGSPMPEAGVTPFSEEAPKPPLIPPPRYTERVLHGSERKGLDRILDKPPERQFDNASSQLGAFFTPDPKEAAYYAGKGGQIYETQLGLENPYYMEAREFYKRWQRPEVAADGTRVAFTEGALEKRLGELKEDAAAFRQELEAAGHDGVVVRDKNGRVTEVAVFGDVPVGADKPFTPKPRTPFRSGKGMGRGGKESGAMLSDVGGKVYEQLVDKPYDFVNAVIGGKILKPASDAAGGVIGGAKVPLTGKKVADFMRDPAANISPEFLDMVRQNRGGREWATDQKWQTVRDIRIAKKGKSEEVSDALSQWGSSRSSRFPPELEGSRPLIEGLVDMHKRVGQMKVDNGDLNPESYKQYERHLPRLIAQHLQKQIRGKGKAPQQERNYQRQDGWANTYKGEDIEVITDIAKSLNPNAVVVPFRGKVGVKFPERTPEGDINVGAMEAWKALDDSLLDALGRRPKKVDSFEPLPQEWLDEFEVLDPELRFGKAVYDDLVYIADQKFVQQILTGSDAKGPMALDKPAQGYRKMTGERFGALRNKFVREDISDYLTMEPDDGIGSSFINGAVSSIKGNWTLYTGAGAFRQMHSVPQVLAQIGMANPLRPKYFKLYSDALSGLKRGTPKYEEYVKNDVTKGVVLMDVAFDRIHGALSRKDMPASWKIGYLMFGPWKLSKTGVKVETALGNFYSLGDRFGRAVAWEYAKQMLKMNDADARTFMNKFTDNYAELGQATDRLRRSWAGSPFGAFQREKTRTLFNTARERPLDAANAFFMREKMKAILAAAGITMMLSSDEEEAIQNEMGSTEIPLYRDKEGNIVSFDARYSDRWGDYWKRPDKLGEFRWLNLLTENTGIDVNFVLMMISDIVKGETKYRERVWEKRDDDWTRIAKSAWHAFRTGYPSTIPGVGYQARNVAASAMGEQMVEGRPQQTLAQALGSALFGLRVRPIDLAGALDDLSRDYKGAREYIVKDRKKSLRQAYEDGEIGDRELYDIALKALHDEFIERQTPILGAVEQKNAAKRRVPIEAK